ncbi:MAG: hypothetical protein RML95_01290 [Anaerolineae bacterium]|nr:hypothetical protein [Anaerolineae bacterium]MDW8297948.1 hypothetical protein [Anaerolineae bacterium]
MPDPTRPDLRILALADSGLLPESVQKPFDDWRVLRARDAVVNAVRKRLKADADPMLVFMLERLEAAEDDRGIFEGIYALAEVVDLHRVRTGLHSEYLVLVMAGRLNPYGLLALTTDFDHVPASAVEAAHKLWELATAHNVNVRGLLAVRAEAGDDPTLERLQAYYNTLLP